jgi:predicted DNA-binding protein
MKRGDDMSPRTGRPTKNPKQNRESFRLSDNDIEKLNYCVKATGMSKTDIIRKGINLVYQEVTKK